MNAKAEPAVAMRSSCIGPNPKTSTKATSNWRPSTKQPQQPRPPPPAMLRKRPQHNITHDIKKRASASDVLELMDSLQLPVDAEMYDSFIKECTFSMDAVQGTKIHAHITKPRKKKSGCSRSRLVNLANRLLLMYVACDCSDVALQLFDEMSKRNASSWATIICTMAQSGRHGESIGLFIAMLRSHSAEPTDTLALLIMVALGSCVEIGELGFGKQLHGLAAKMVVNDTLAAPLIEFYAASNCLESAQKVFDSMPCFSCINLISAYCREGRFQEAVRVFADMFDSIRSRNNNKKNKSVSIAFACILSACTRMEMGPGIVLCGRQVHAFAIKIGMDTDLYAGTSLVNMYGRFGLLGEARRAFDAVCSSNMKDTACWNAMIRSYVRNGCGTEAVKVLYEMKSAGIEPSVSIVGQVRIACGGF